MQENIIDAPYQERNKQPIDEYELPKYLPRFAAAAIDLALYVLLSFLILTIGGLIVGGTNQTYKTANQTLNNHISYSKLAKYEEVNGYVSYNENDLLTLEEEQPLIVKRLSYFYLSYLTGENLEVDAEPSLEKDEYIIIDGLSYLPKDYYTVKFFNEKILKINDENSGGKYFKYATNGDTIDENQIAIIDVQFVTEISSNNETIKRLKNDTGLVAFLKNIYQDAIKVFYAQKSIKMANQAIRDTNIALMFIATMPSFCIFYLIIPLLSPFGKTIGKHIFSLAVTTDKGYLAKKWQIPLRYLIILGITVYVCLISSIYYQLLVVILLLLISLGVLLFTPRKKALHDLMAATVVIKTDKNTIIYPNEERYQQALEIMKQRKEASDGQH